MDNNSDRECIFCDIANGRAPCFLIYDDLDCMAFLTPYPNTYGQTVVITKKHYSSYYANTPLIAINKLMRAIKKVAQMLDNAYKDVGRTAVVFEGWGVDHLHAKLYPMHGTIDPNKRQKSSSIAFFDVYPGYVTTENKHQRMNDDLLREHQRFILQANGK